MKLYPCLILPFVFFCFDSFAQKDSTVVGYASQRRETHNSMNRLRVEPQLTQRLYNTGRGHDAYKLKDGMICLTPDSTVLQRLVVVKPKEQ